MPKDMKGVMSEFVRGQLHSGSKTGRRVTKRKQAIAIGLSEQRQQGKRVAPPPKRPAAPKKKQRAPKPPAPFRPPMGKPIGKKNPIAYY